MKMEPKKNNVIASLLGGVAISGLFLLTACGDDGSSKTAGGTEEDAGIIAITDKMVSGVSQKGPFANGSSVTVYELDGKTLAQTGSSFEGKIKNDLGEFSVKVVSLASQYALLKANGFYRNEITGEKSNSQITLYALTDLSDRDEVNVNLLTHLAYERSLFLATEDSLPVAKAKKQAEAEVFQSFGIEGVADAAEDLNIFGESDQSAALLAVSILMQGNLKEADFSERLNDYAQDIEADGVWDDAVTATQVADWAAEQGLGAGLVSIRGNVQAWNSLAGVPDFEKYVNNFWYQNYGLGTCDKKREGEVKKNQNAASVRANEYFICKSGTWVLASDLEKDTYKWEAGKDADVKNGDVVATNCYVFEDKAWRTGNENDCSLKLRGCTKLRQDTVGQGVDKAWYICDARNWREATDIEKDTATWGTGKFDGEVRLGQVNKNAYYIYKTDKKIWREATTLELDTYDYKNNKTWTGKDGDNKAGSVNVNNCYVFENNAWRSGNENDCSLKLRGCTKLRQDTVGLGSDDVWYTCDAENWREATDIEKDTYGHKCTDGKIFTGKVNLTAKYVCDEGLPRILGFLEDIADTACTSYNRGKLYILPKAYYRHVKRYDDSCPYFAGDQKLEYTESAEKNYSYYKCTEKGWLYSTEILNQGTVTDPRDGQTYKTIGFKDKIWMAENMNYAIPEKKGNHTLGICNNHNCDFFESDSLSYCYNNIAENCINYGRIYYGSNAARSACPDGWRIPEVYEFVDLFLEMKYEILWIESYGYLQMRSGTLNSENFLVPFLPRGGGIGLDYDESLGMFQRFRSSEISSYFWYNRESTPSATLEIDNNSFFSPRSEELGYVRCVKDAE